ncbi:MAG: class I SAM-dependent methyltransferase [Mycobacteriales bacterium]
MTSQDEINQATWSAQAGDFAAEGWLDPAEPAAFVAAADLTRGRPVLDLGVGAGRTTSLLRVLSPSYVGVDYNPEMLALARRRHPREDLRLLDVRDLSALAPSSFGLVVMSNNGLDAIPHQDRPAALAGMRRVLRPDGCLLLTALNKEGPLYDCRPGAVPSPTWRSHLIQGYPQGTEPPSAPLPTDAFTRSLRNWRKLSRLSEDHGEWAVAPLPAYEFGVLAHFATLDWLRREMSDAGFEVRIVWGCESPSPLPDAATRSAALYFYLLGVPAPVTD